jgi:hypothetical protein
MKIQHNKIKTLLPILALAAATSFASAGTTEDVTKTLNQHFSGIKQGKIELINSVWIADQASITEIKGKNLTKQDVKKTFAMWSKEKHPSFKANIKSVTNISDAIAVARVEINWKGDVYLDALTLVKSGNDWKIISKVYQAPKVAKSSYGL